MAVYCVSNLQDLLGAVIPHFEKFPLITQKQIDFELFKKIVVLLSQNLPSSYALQLKTAL